MGKSANGIVILMAISSIILDEFGLGLKFEVNPDAVTNLVPVDIRMYCEVEASEVRGARFESLSIKHVFGNFSNLVAAVEKDESAVSMNNRAKAIGHLQEDGRDTFLHVNMTQLQINHQTTYACVARFVGEFFSKQKTQILSVKYTAEYGLQLGYRQMMKKTHDVAKRIDVHGEKLDEIISKGNLNVHFKTFMKKGDTIRENQITIFRKVIINVGEDYDIRTGKFKVPYSGFYLFQFGLHVARRNYVVIDIKTKNRVLTRIGGMAYGGWNNYGEGSVLAKLDKGEEVYPYIETTRHGSLPLRVRTSCYCINHWAGYLMKAV